MKKFAFGVLTVAAVMAMAVPAFAAEGGAGSSNGLFIPIGVGLTLGLAAFASAFGQGRAASAALDGIARNPAAAGKIQVPMILGLAFMEALTIFAWLVARDLVGKI
ncbi:MAG TPA: ATP synthase F0 subunit C [bacterium]|nr:ATP synthase F0 subunit C [bacterium]